MIAQNDPDEKLVSTQDISLKKCYYYIMFRNIVFKKYKAKRDLAWKKQPTLRDTTTATKSRLFSQDKSDRFSWGLFSSLLRKVDNQALCQVVSKQVDH